MILDVWQVCMNISNSTKWVRYIIVAHILLVDVFWHLVRSIGWSCQHTSPASKALAIKAVLQLLWIIGMSQTSLRRWQHIPKTPGVWRVTQSVSKFLTFAKDHCRLVWKTGMDSWFVGFIRTVLVLHRLFSRRKNPQGEIALCPKACRTSMVATNTGWILQKLRVWRRSLRSFITRRGGRYFAMLQQIRRNS